MAYSTTCPFFGEIPSSVKLEPTPLAGVLVQIQFKNVLSLAKEERVADIQERVHERFPFLDRSQDLALQLIHEGPVPGISPVWRFLDTSRLWRFSLATSFVSLETRSYQSREDFANRVEHISSVLSETVDYLHMSRIGVRYVDRIHSERLQKIESYIRPEILGVYSGDTKHKVGHTVSELNGRADVGLVKARCGFMPAKQSYELDLIPPIESTSWFLDVDVYEVFSAPEKFETSTIREKVVGMSKRAYAFFRWAVSDDLLREYGGDP